MTKTATKKAATNGRKAPAVGAVPETNSFEHSYTQVLLDRIIPSAFETQTRRRAKFTVEEIAELADSIKANGLIQPITVRPATDFEVVPGARSGKPGYFWESKKRSMLFGFSPARLGCNENPPYEIVCGERRFLACQKAGLDKIDVVVRNLSDAAALDVQITENLQRKDVDPIDEAFSFKYLLDLGKYTIHDLAVLLGRPEKFIRQRLRLNELLPEILDEVSKGWLPLGHAMEIAKFPAAVQLDIHKRETAYEWKEVDDDPELSDDNIQVWPLADFRAALRREISLKLSETVFDIADDSLHPEGLACGSCPQRTGFEPLLFEEELADGDACLNKACFDAKVLVHLTRQRDAIAAELPNKKKLPIEDLVKKVPLVTDGWAGYNETPIFEQGEKILEHQEFFDQPECDYATPALVVKGDRKGQRTYICNDGHCKKHGKKSESSTSSANNDWEKRQKENEFQISVAEAVRMKVFRESMDHFVLRGFWSDKDLMADLISSFWNQRHYYVRNVVDVVIKEWHEKAPVNTSDRKRLAKFVRQLSEPEMSQLVFLLTYAGEGFSSYSLAEQDGVIAVNDRYGKLNYKLVDAETRLELAPKEFKSQAKTYLKAVQSGEEVEIPHFWHEEKKSSE
jgi:ParB/RepB/Spo0J family partition protein